MLELRTGSIALVVMMAGCMGQAAPGAPVEAVGGDTPPASATPSSTAVAPQALTWDGYLRVGALAEWPAHFRPSADLTEGLWRPGFVIEIAEAPEVLEVRLDWTSTGPSNLFLVVNAPDGAQRANESGFATYNTHAMMDMAGGQGGASTGPLCIGIPRADLLDDIERISKSDSASDHGAYWYVMAHSHAGAEIKLHFTITSVGGVVSMPDAKHGYDTNPETLQNAVETMFVSPDRPWDACSVSVEK